jgi:hypothetical protein
VKLQEDRMLKHVVTVAALVLATGAAVAKLPALNDEAKAKAAEAAAKTAHGNKVADFQLCKSMNKVSAYYHADAKKSGKEVKPPTATPDCVDPGAFAYPPPAPGAAAPAPAAAAGAKPPAKKT